MSQGMNINQNMQHLQMPIVATDANKVAPQNAAANPSIAGKGMVNAGAPVTVSAMVEMKQALVNTGLIDPETERDPRCSMTVSTDDPDSPTQNPFYTSTAAMSPVLLQTLNNKFNTKMEIPTAINVEGGDGMPEGTYGALSYALSVSASAISQVNDIVGGNSARIAQLNTLMGVSAMQIYETQLNQQQANMEKQENVSHVGHVFAEIGKIGGEILAGAMIVGGLLTGDPAMVMIGVMMLAMCNSFISSHVTDGLAAGILQIPGMASHPMIAHGIAEGLVAAAMITACVLSGNVGGAESAVAEVVEGAETVAKGAETVSQSAVELEMVVEESGAEASEIESAGEFSDSGASLTGMETPNVGQAAIENLQSEMLQEGVNAGEKTMRETFNETIAQVTQLLENLGSNPSAQKALSAVKGVSGILQMTGMIGQATTEGIMAQLTMNYAVLQATLEWVQNGLDSVDMRNELNTSLAKDVTQANFRELIGMFNAEASAIGSVAQNMYQA